MRPEKEFIPDRPDGCPVATDRALGARAEARRATGEVPAARNNQRHSLHHSQRLHLASVAARSSLVSDCVSLLSSLATRRNVGVDSRETPGTGATRGGQDSQAVGRCARQPKCEDDRTRRAARLRRGKKRSSAASGMWWLTRWACFGLWSLRRPACKIAMADDSLCRRFTIKSSSPRSFGPTRRTDRWCLGSACSGYGSWKSSPGLAAGLKFNPSDGSSSVRLVGSTAHDAWPNLSNERRRAITPLYKLL